MLSILFPPKYDKLGTVGQEWILLHKIKTGEIKQEPHYFEQGAILSKREGHRWERKSL